MRGDGDQAIGQDTLGRFGRACVYTALVGDYELLTEQPVAQHSRLPFICFTDRPGLVSRTWQIRQVPPLFPADPVRSQRAIKIRAHAYLPDFDASLYIDNSVQLTIPPDGLFARYLAGHAMALPHHSFRNTVADEFREVARERLEDPQRIAEQLDAYTTHSPGVLQERPYWSAILLRDHRVPELRNAMDIWLSHVIRYARRDQLSSTVAFAMANLHPHAMQIDNFASDFHVWPVMQGRDETKRIWTGPVAAQP